MSRPINRQPLGLLSLFDVKSPAGRYPSELLEQIAPIVDSLKFYRPQALRVSLVLQGAGAVTGPTRFSQWTVPGNLVVPQGEFWFIGEYTAEAALQADQSIMYAPALAIYFGIQAQVYRLGDYINIGTGTGTGTLAARGVASAHYWMPRIIGPGNELGFTVAGFTPGASLSTTLTGNLHRIVLPI